MSIERKDIIAKTKDLFNKYGFKSITMDDVARELGISKKTLYLHISEKKELIEEVVLDEFNDFKKSIEACVREDKDAVFQLIEVIHCVGEFFKRISQVATFDLKKYLPSLNEKISRQYVESLTEVLIQNIKLGKNEDLYRPDIDEKVIAKIHVSRIERIPESGIYNINEYTSPRFFYETCNYHIRGIANEKGIKLSEKYLEKYRTNI